MTEYQSRQMEKMLKFLCNVDLSQEEIRTLIWLAGWEESTVDALLSVMDKVAQSREYKGLKQYEEKIR